MDNMLILGWGSPIGIGILMLCLGIFMVCLGGMVYLVTKTQRKKE
jgi:hypothetical protein